MTNTARIPNVKKAVFGKFYSDRLFFSSSGPFLISESLSLNRPAEKSLYNLFLEQNINTEYRQNRHNQPRSNGAVISDKLRFQHKYGIIQSIPFAFADKKSC